MSQSQQPDGNERERLLLECHDLVARIGQHRYGVRLLRAARDGLSLYANYKGSRRRGGG